MKMTAKDVDAHFPASDSSTTVRSFLKETLALMFNMTDIKLLADLYQRLSTILNSKYITNEVTEAFNFITGCVDKTKKDEIEVNEIADENPEILEIDEPKNDPIYKQSKFYKMFAKLTTRPDYNNKSNQLNNFYCPAFINLFLSKYISILPLWTCLNGEGRKSKSNAESLFNIIKTKLRESAPRIGRLPIRSSRFLRFTRQYINNIAEVYWQRLPRYNCCNRKRDRSASNSPHTATKRRRPNSPQVRSNIHSSFSQGF